MNQIELHGDIYNLHPIYDQYASSKSQIIDIIKKANIDIHNHKDFLYMNAKRQGSPLAIPYTIHRFVWECFNGDIPENSVIEHIDNNLFN